MNTAQLLAEWAIRSSILILCAALLLRALRVKDASIRLAAWTAIVCSSLAIPVLIAVFPKLPLALMPAAAPAHAGPVLAYEGTSVHEVIQQQPAPSTDIDWARIAAATYALIAGILLLRLSAGLLLTRRLLTASRATGLKSEGIEIRESDRITSPVTVGILRSNILLPVDWPGWSRAKLDAVLAHEMSHVRRKDPAIQLLSAIHRALLWYSPLSWFVHRSIVRLAEEASDDAAVAVTRDRASYAEVLLDFMQRGVQRVDWHGVAMARYGRPDERIHRILDGRVLSNGVTRGTVAAIGLLALPLAYLTAAAQPQRAPQVTRAPRTPQIAESAATLNTPAHLGQPPMLAQAAAQKQPSESDARKDRSTTLRYRICLGDTQSGSWDSNDRLDDEALRSRFGRRFAWFRQGGNEYVVTDAGVLAEIERAMEPQEKVNRMQDQVNGLQSVVNESQSKVNSQQNEVNGLQDHVNQHQNEVNALQEGVNQRQDLLNRIQSSATKEDKEALIQKMEAAIRELRNGSGGGDQETVNRRQAEVNAEQHRVNEAQNKVNSTQSGVNAEQDKVNAEQHKVNEEQARVSAQFNERIREIFDSAVRRRLAQRLL